jgi:hypothetical protein
MQETSDSIINGIKLRDNKRFRNLWCKRLIIGYFICMTIYFIWLFAIQGATIQFNTNIQKNYAKFLVSQNDEFVTYMMEFEALTSETGREYSSAEKEAIKNNLVKQNELLKSLQKKSPEDKNNDYIDLYQDTLQLYAFYIQGEVMIAEYCYAYTDNYTLEDQYSNSSSSLEQYTMGKELCNMMGNMILNNYKYINEIRNTDIKSKHNIVEIGTKTEE